MLTLSKVFDKNVEAYKSDKRYIINRGGTSSSKTFSTLQLLVLLSVKYPLHIDIVGLSVPHLKSGVLNDMPAVCNQMGINFDECFNISDRSFKAGKGHINFLAFDKLGKAHGGRRDILFLNEANHLPYPIVEQLMIRTRQKVFIDFNPTGVFWVHSEVLKNEPEKCIEIQSTYKDNQFLEQAIIDGIEARRGDGNNNFWRVYGLGELGVAEGLIFNNFEQLEFDRFRFASYYNGVDWGFSLDEFAFVRCAVEQNNLYICDEIYQKKLLNKDSAPLVKRIVNGEIVTCDSAEPKSIAEYRTLGINAHSAKKGAGSVEHGIKYLQQFDKIYIHPSCANLYNEFCNYQWQKDKMGYDSTKPVDAFNHGIDALRYSLEPLSGFKQIKAVKGLRL